MKMGPKTSELCNKLRSTIELLDDAHENHWSKWMSNSLRRIENRDFSGVEHLLRSFGGMGSFNDLVLCSANGHSISDEQYAPVNDRLDSLRGELYELADYIKRTATIE